MRGVHEPSEVVEVPGPQRLHRFQNARVLRDYVPGAQQLLAGEAVQIVFRGVAQLLDAQRARGALAGGSAVVVACIGEAALDARVADRKGESRPFEVKGYALCFEGSAVDEEGDAGLAEQGGVLVHDAAVHTHEVVLGPLAEHGEVLPSQPEPAEGVEGEGCRGLDRRGRGEPRPERHVPGEGRPEGPDLAPLSPYSYPSGCDCIQDQASEIMASSSGFLGFQPNSSRILALEANSVGGSPAL